MYFSCASNQSRQSISKGHKPTKTKESFVLSRNYETWKPKTRIWNVQNVSSNGTLLKKEKKRHPNMVQDHTQNWCWIN